MKTRVMKALRAACIAALAPLLCAQTLNLNDLLASMRKRIETADFRATGHLVWVQPSGARLSYPITIKAHWFPGVLREFVEMGAAQDTRGWHIPASTPRDARASRNAPQRPKLHCDRASRRQISDRFAR